MLNLVDKTLYQMALTVQPGIVVARLLAALVRRDHGLSASFKHKVDKVVACVGSVSNHMLAGKALSHFNGFCAVVTLACGQAYAQGIAQTIGAHMNLGDETASTTSQSLRAVFFCAPAAHG